MVAGRLQEKNGFYYIVLSYTDSAGKRRQPWIGTGLPVKGNKKRAEKMLAETRKDFTIPKGQVSELSPDMAFSDYMRYWLKMMRTAVTETTYSSYCFNVEKHIIPYFEPLGVTLAGLQPRQIQSFYLHEAETLKNTSILRFHANLHKALKYAVRIDLIASNPVDKVDRPKPQAFMASYYSAEEMEKLFEAARGHKLELIIQLAAFYGLRRAEVMGLRWEAIDFEAKTLTIRHIVTSTRIDGKKILVEADRTKTKSSLRTLPLVDPIAERLKAVKEQQEYNQKICGNCYNQEYLGYVFVDAMGNLIQPDSVTTGFPQLLKENGLRRIRFHDLRHSCASLMVMNGVSMKQVQEWLGHSTFSTTADIYAHLDYKSKQGVCWGHCEPSGRIQAPQIIMDLSFIYKAYCDEEKAVFLCLMQKKKSQVRLNLRLLAEMVGFEPTCPIKDKTISSRSRYDRFDTSPSIFSWQIYDLYIANRP